MPEPPASAAPGEAAGAPVAPEALPLHVEWLAERGGGTAVVDLHPPHLGRVEISVRVVGDEVEVSIASQDSQVQGVLDAQRGNLEQSLAGRNLRMTLFDLGLSGSPERGFANASRDPQSGAHERSGAEASSAPKISAAGEATATAASARSARSQNGIDLHA
jgi:flagellar hook-length control protein FliK